MSKVKNTRTIGVRGIGVINSNLNSGFDKMPKTLPDGRMFNSDVSTKFLDRTYMVNSGCNVLVKKTIKKTDNGDLYSCTFEDALKERLDESREPLLQIVTDYTDIQNFGGLITPYGFGITGVVQYHQGINMLEDSSTKIQDILSPWGTGNNKTDTKNKEEDANVGTNIGKHTFVDRAFYVQSFSVNPQNLNSLVGVFNDDSFRGYTEDSYNVFKKAVLMSATLFSTRSKAGISDEFAVFVNLKEGSLYGIVDIARFIKVSDNDGFVVDLTELDFLDKVDDVESVEIYHNSKTCKIIQKLKKAVVKDSLLGC